MCVVHFYFSMITSSKQVRPFIYSLCRVIFQARTDKYLRMRYQFMLEIDAIDEQRKKIIKLQNQLRQYG